MAIYKFLIDYDKQIELLNLTTDKWEDLATSMEFGEDKVFEDFAAKLELDKFYELARKSGGMIATIADMDDELNEEDLIDSDGVAPGSYCFVSKGVHWVNRVGYIIYRIIDPLLRDPFNQEDFRNKVCCLW